MIECEDWHRLRVLWNDSTFRWEDAGDKLVYKGCADEYPRDLVVDNAKAYSDLEVAETDTQMDYANDCNDRLVSRLHL